jgi:hypothetical protein
MHSSIFIRSGKDTDGTLLRNASIHLRHELIVANWGVSFYTSCYVHFHGSVPFIRSGGAGLSTWRIQKPGGLGSECVEAAGTRGILEPCWRAQIGENLVAAPPCLAAES